MNRSLPTPPHNLTVSLATPDEAPDVFSIFEDVIAWLTAQGRDQWAGEFDAHVIRDRWMTNAEVYLLRDGALPVATATLYHNPGAFDDAVWTGVVPDETLTGATFLHKLAVRRSYAGQGLSNFLITYSEAVALARGKSFVLLDTDADVPALCTLYEAAGYTRAGTAVMLGWNVALYKKKVS